MNENTLKENMIKNLEIDIIKYKEYLQYFSLNPENYSKALQLDLEEFSQRIKDSEEYLSTFEKNKLIFIPNETFNDKIKISNINDYLNLIKNNLEHLKIKLISLKKNHELSYKERNTLRPLEKDFGPLIGELKQFKNFQCNMGDDQIINDDKSVI